MDCFSVLSPTRYPIPPKVGAWPICWDGLTAAPAYAPGTAFDASCCCTACAATSTAGLITPSARTVPPLIHVFGGVPRVHLDDLVPERREERRSGASGHRRADVPVHGQVTQPTVRAVSYAAAS
ncbi:hypothetical protein [Streptomyces sp. NPDC001948]